MNANKLSSKTTAWALSLAMVLALVPVTAIAASSSYAIDNSSTVLTHQTNIQDRLDSAGNGNTVTVTGSRTSIVTGFVLTIPSGVTLIWQASLSGDTMAGEAILKISGAGSFRMESGSIVNAETGTCQALQSTVTGGVEITGTASISATGNSGIPLQHTSAGTVAISGSAQIGGKVAAVVGGNSGCTITVSGSGVLTSSNLTLSCLGPIVLTGGTVEATGSNNAVQAQGTLSISGSAIVRATGSNGAIAASGNVTVSGGTVSSATAYAISNSGSASVVAISGGEVTSGGGYTIYMSSTSNTAENVVVSGSAKVSNTGTGSAIRSSGDVKVEGNAQVSAKTGTAINGKNVTINSGAVFAYGTAITGSGNVIQATGTYTAPTTNGIAIAWDNTAGITAYPLGGSQHIAIQPQGGSAYWSVSDAAGIWYSNGSTRGLIPVSGVTVSAGDIPPSATGVSIDAGAHGFPAVGVEVTGDYTFYAGAGLGAGAESGSIYQWYRGNSATWGGSGHTQIPGATGVTYTPTYEDIGKYLFFEVRPSNGTIVNGAVHSAASAQAGIWINFVVNKNGTTGAATISATSTGVTGQYKVVSSTSPTLGATLGNSPGVNWTVSADGGTFSNAAALNPGYALPTLSGITGAITITATFTADTTAPILSAVTGVRLNMTTASVTFTTDKAGTAYTLAVNSGDPAPANTEVKATGTNRGAVTVGSNTKTVSLTGDQNEKDAYVVVEDAAGNISEALKIEVGAYGIRVNGGAPLITSATIQSAITDALAMGDATVTGLVSLSSVGNPALNITIPDGRTLTWSANYSYTDQIIVQGGGALRITDSGKMSSNYGGSYILSLTESVSAVVEGIIEGRTATSAIALSGSAKLTVNGGTVTGYANAISAQDSSAVTVSGGTLNNRTINGAAIILTGNAALAITGGTVQSENTSGVVVSAGGTSTVYVSGGTVAAAGIKRISTGTAYYTGAANAAMFNTSGTDRFTANTNLFRLDGYAPNLTQGTAAGSAYSYQSGAENAYDGAVVAAFPAGLTITGTAATPTTATNSVSSTPDNLVTFAGTFDHNAITLAIMGTLAGGRIPVSFTTASFGLNIKGNAPPDTTPPTLTAGTVSRTSDTAATVEFTSDEAGTYYYQLDGATPTEASLVTAGTNATAMIADEQTISFTSLAAGVHTLYIAAKDAVGNVSNLLTVNIPAYGATTYSVSINNSEHDPIVSTQYYNLQGIAAAQPQAGQIYIVKETRQSGKVTSELRLF